MKGFLFKCMTVILIVAALLIFTELGLRIFWSGKPKIPSIPPNPRYCEDEDNEISYKLFPNQEYNKGAVTTNKYGFRIDPTITEEKKQGIFRIVLIGDSIVFGVRLHKENTIGAFLQKKLSEIELPGFNEFEVINLGMPGYNINQYAAVLGKYGMKYSPDLIVAGITISNDLEGRQARYLGNGHIYLEPTAAFKGINSEHRLPPKIIRSFYIWRYLYFRFFEPKRQDEKRRLALVSENVPPKLLYAPIDDTDEVWEKVKSGISQIDGSAKKAGSELIFILFPAAEQIYYQDIDDIQQKIIKRIINKHERDVLDFYDIFLDIYRITAFLPFNDLASHPSARSNEIIASMIRDYIAGERGASLKSEFSGFIKLGFDNDMNNLSYGWGQRRKTGDVRFRNVQGAEARIVFGKGSGNYSRIDLVAAGLTGCVPQTIDIFLNSEKMGSFVINEAGMFNKHSIVLNKILRLTDYNTVDIKLSTPCAIKGNRVLARYDRLDTVSISRIDLK